MTSNERVKHIRESLNLSMDKFGQTLGVGKSAINKIEKGENNLSEQMIKSICHAYDIREEWLRTGIGEMRENLSGSDELIKLFTDVLKEDNSSFRKQFFEVLARLTVPDWSIAEQFFSLYFEIFQKLPKYEKENNPTHLD